MKVVHIFYILLYRKEGVTVPILKPIYKKSKNINISDMRVKILFLYCSSSEICLLVCFSPYLFVNSFAAINSLSSFNVYESKCIFYDYDVSNCTNEKPFKAMEVKLNLLFLICLSLIVLG